MLLSVTTRSLLMQNISDHMVTEWSISYKWRMVKMFISHKFDLSIHNHKIQLLYAFYTFDANSVQHDTTLGLAMVRTLLFLRTISCCKASFTQLNPNLR